MEEDVNKEKQSEYFEQVLKQYVKNKELFFNEVSCKALSGLASGSKVVHVELMDLSDAILIYSRTLKESTKTKDLRSLSFVLRKIAQTIFNKSNPEEDDKRFLKLVP